MVAVSSFEEAVSLIKDRLDIVDTISQYVVLKKSGPNYWGICPFHDDKHPSMSVSPSKGIYKCFACGAGGDAVGFLMKIQNKEFKEVIIELADKFGIELPKKLSPSNENKTLRAEMLEACKKAALFYNKNLKSGNDSKKALNYLTERGISNEIIDKFTLGLALNKYDTLYKELKNDFSEETLEKAGLILKSNKGGWIDRFRNRVIIPIQNENGDYIAFGARALDEGQNPKYLNSSDSMIYNKSKTLFGLYTAKDSIREEDAAIIMEGYFDVITAQANGVTNAVASCGTSMTAEHIKLLSRFTPHRRIFLSFDTDSAGINATKRGGEIIKETFSSLGQIKQFDESHISTSSDNKYACEIRVISPPQGKDPDEFIRTMGGDSFKQYVKDAPLLIDFLLNNILKEKSEAKTPQQKSELVEKIIDILKDVNNKIIQTEYVKMVSSALNINEEAVLKELKKADNAYLQRAVPVVQKTNVTNSSQFKIKAQKNLLSVFISDGGNKNYEKLIGLLPENIIQDETLIIVKNTIDKLSHTVNNVRELIKNLFTEFIEDDNLTKILTDLVEMAESFNDLETEDLEQAVRENIARLRRCYAEQDSEKLRSRYREVNDDDIEALKLQVQLRDKIKLRTGDK